MNIDIEQLRKMRADGVPNPKIQAYFKCPKTTLEKIVKAHKLPPKPSRTKQIDMDQFRAEWMAETPTAKMAEIFGQSANSILKKAREDGLPRRSHGGRRVGCKRTTHRIITKIRDDHSLKVGRVSEVYMNLSNDQLRWVASEAAKVGCETLAEYLTELVRDAHAEATQ